MFRRLKLKLTLINVGVLIVVIALLMTGIYALMVLALSGQSEEQLRLIAETAGSAQTTTINISKKYTPQDFYVKLDQTGKIFATSPELPIPPAQLQLLVAQALQQPERAIIPAKLGLDEYRFLRTPLANGQGSVLVFLRTNQEKLLIGHLIIAFMITGVGGIVLTLFCSLFMANRALIPIQLSWESQKNFVADASHELRTPLTVIQTNSEVVLDSPNETVGNQMLWLENIKLESELMAKLVEDLLFLARTNSPQAILEPEHFNLNQAIKEVITPLEPVAANKSQQLKSYLRADVAVFADRTRIKQLVAILIDNALKYTPPGGEINLQLQDTGNRVQIIVSDTGEGISSEHLAKVFERFYRVDTARSRESGGTGLGLPIAEWIVKEHHGTIKVNSILQQGTTVTVSLPKDNLAGAKQLVRRW